MHKPKRQEILERGISLTTGDRNEAHGEPYPNMVAFAKLVEAYLRALGWSGPALDAVDAAMILNQHKASRVAANKQHEDNYVDGSTYLAIAGECASILGSQLENLAPQGSVGDTCDLRAKLSVDDVRAAARAFVYEDRGSKTDARSIIQRIGKGARLADFTESQYREAVEALSSHDTDAADYEEPSLEPVKPSKTCPYCGGGLIDLPPGAINVLDAEKPICICNYSPQEKKEAIQFMSRNRNTKIRFVTQGANLVGVDLSGLDLSCMDFRRADFSRANLSKTDLTYAVFNKADFNEANLTGADMTRAQCNKASFYGADLSFTNLTNTVFIDADLKDARFGGAQIGGADFAGTQLYDKIRDLLKY